MSILTDSREDKFARIGRGCGRAVSLGKFGKNKVEFGEEKSKNSGILIHV